MTVRQVGPDVSARVRLVSATDRPFAVVAERVRVGPVPRAGHAGELGDAELRSLRADRGRLPFPIELGRVTVSDQALRIRGSSDARDAVAKQGRAARSSTLLQRAYPDAKIALDFSTPLELLVATILSAQCTDERVNMVTPRCSASIRPRGRWPRRTPKLEKEIRSTGFFRAKTRSLLGMARGLVERHGGEVPGDRDALTALPGIGLKTANVVLGNAFGQDALAVDTHVFRVSQRLGLAKSDDAEEIHDQLVTVLPKGHLTQGTHLLIIHGRRTCLARKPACPSASSGPCVRGPARPAPDAPRALTPQGFS